MGGNTVMDFKDLEFENVGWIQLAGG